MTLLEVLRQKLNTSVLLVLVAFGFLYYVSVFCVIVPWLSYSVNGVLNLAILTFTWSTSMYCYLRTVFSDPGGVPAEWMPDGEADTAVQEVKRKGGGIRYCTKCNNYKPARSHHCRQCQRCILRMDHHCPWANNCVGHGNYRAFFLFLIYVSAALVHCVGLIGAHAVHVVQTSRRGAIIRTGPQAKPVQLHNGIRSVWVWAMIQTVAFAAALPLAIALLQLLFFHLWMVASNKTTIEHLQGITAEVKALTLGEAQPEHPYDLGLWRNLHAILGPNPPHWLIPPVRTTPGGMVFPTRYDFPESPRLL